MSLEQEIKELRETVTLLTDVMLKMTVPTLQVDSKQLVPEFLKKDGPGLITENTGMTGQTAEMPEAGPSNNRSEAAKKAAVTRAANKAKKEAAAAKAKEEETEAVAEAEETGFDPFALDDADVPTDFVEEVEDDDEMDFMDAAEAEAPGLSVMGEKDPRGTLRKHITSVSKILSETGKAETLADLLHDKEAGFGHSGFKALPENKFDSFLNAAVELLPSDRQKEIG